VAAPLVLPGYECALKCSHLFKRARCARALSVTERPASSSDPAAGLPRGRRLRGRARGGGVSLAAEGGGRVMSRPLLIEMAARRFRRG